MLYIAVREVEGGGEYQIAVFTEPREAWKAYEQAQLVADNDPDEFGDGDPTIVSNCSLFRTDTDDPAIAMAMVNDGRAVHVESYEELVLHGDETP